MKCKICGSHAINEQVGEYMDLCDVCYWRERARQEKRLMRCDKCQYRNPGPSGFCKRCEFIRQQIRRAKQKSQETK